MKKTLLVSLLASSMLFNTACTEDQVNNTILGIGVVVGVAAIAAADAHNHDDYNDGYHDGRHEGYHDGRHDGYRDGRHDGWHDGYYRGYASEINLDGQAFSALTKKTSPLVAKYHISSAAADKIENAFAGAKTKGVDSFASIGLSKGDLKDLAKRELPESSTIKNVADKLDMSEAQTRDLFKDIIAQYEAQASNVASPYWKSCMATGKWRTPQNLYCKNTAWNGCSPTTGATACY